VLIEDGVIRFRDALLAKRDEVEAAWADAEQRTVEALRKEV
jgi:hypothetical protein